MPHSKIHTHTRSMDQLISVMKKLRSEKGCPWDREQTHSSLKKYLMEECAELMDSIDDKDTDGICEELGDLLMHIVFHSQIAEENKSFTFEDVVGGITEKMIRRHPHVFGDGKAENSSEVVEMWEVIKGQEKKERNRGRKSLMDGIPRHLPALFRAHEMQRKAAKVGFDWSNSHQIMEKIGEEMEELKKAIADGDEKSVNEEIGDLIFSAVNLARFRKGTSAEEILACTIQKFERRFRYIEEKLASAGKSAETSSPDEMDGFWNEAKKNGL
ncbi:MAG: nucleoside triphosphate pyrophosphohydrolase [Victivallales bacterium]